VQNTYILFLVSFLAVAGLIAISLFLWYQGLARPLRSRELPHQNSQVIQVDGVEIHFVQSGSGPHLVLLHGIGAHLFVWRLILPTLSKYFTVTALDLPGFGYSSKHLHRDYGLDSQAVLTLDFLTALKIHKFNLVGSSMGGSIALWMAHREPERVQKLICISPPVTPVLPLFDLSRLVPLVGPLRNLVNRDSIGLLMKRAVVRPEVVDSLSIEAYLNPYLDDGTSAKIFVKAFKSVQDPRLLRALPQLKVLLLFLWGERDRVVPFREAEKLSKVCPQAQLLSIATGGHHTMEDSPDWTAQAILTFFS
jgi:abhydrolase domain-containing protein 6